MRERCKKIKSPYEDMLLYENLCKFTFDNTFWNRNNSKSVSTIRDKVIWGTAP